MRAKGKWWKLEQAGLGQSQDGWEEVREVLNRSWLAQCFVSAKLLRSSNGAEQRGLQHHH